MYTCSPKLHLCMYNVQWGVCTFLVHCTYFVYLYITANVHLLTKAAHACRICSENYIVHAYMQLWCFMPLSAMFQLIVAISFIGGGNRSTRKKPPTFHKSLTNFIHEHSAGFELTKVRTNKFSGNRHQLCR